MGRKKLENILTKGNMSFLAFFRNVRNLSHTTVICGITVDIELDMGTKETYIGIRNKEPIPYKGNRLIYYPITCCDDGYVKFDVWTIDSGSEVKLNSIRIFDQNAEGLYYVISDEQFINVRNDGEQPHASEFYIEGCLYEKNL